MPPVRQKSSRFSPFSNCLQTNPRFAERRKRKKQPDLASSAQHPRRPVLVMFRKVVMVLMVSMVVMVVMKEI